jgi:hypothetical protein
MKELDSEIVRVSKMDSARRQIVTGIWLWFKSADIVSVHTLTGAAFGILSDLSHHRKLGRPMPFDEKFMPPEKELQKKIRNVLKSDETFFKHARNDQDNIHELPTQWTETYILTAVRAYGTLKEKDERLHPLMDLFVFWSALRHPDLWEGNSPPISVKSADVKRLKKLKRIEFFEELGGPFFPEPPYNPIAEALHSEAFPVE